MHSVATGGSGLQSFPSPAPQGMWLQRGPVLVVRVWHSLVSSGPSAGWAFLELLVAVSTRKVVGHSARPCSAEQP